MEHYEYKRLEILLDSVTLIISSYKSRKIPFWARLLRLQPKRLAEVKEIDDVVRHFKKQIDKSVSYAEQIDVFVKMLDGYRYYLSVHTNSFRLREKIQDAMIAVLFFQDSHAAAYKSLVLEQHDLDGYLQRLMQNELLKNYQQFYKKQHAILGRNIERFTDEEILLASKSGMINGAMVERFGVSEVIKHGFSFISKELSGLLEHKIFAGFLSQESIAGYLHKIELLNSADPSLADEAVLVQNARYLLENITNACGISEEDQAMHSEHRLLVKSCFWVDEMIKAITGKLQAIL